MVFKYRIDFGTDRQWLVGITNQVADKSHPVGVGFAYAETLSEVKNWIATLDAKNLQLAPATAALK